VDGPCAILPLLGEAFREQGIEEDFLIHPLVHELQYTSLCCFQLTSGPRPHYVPGAAHCAAVMSSLGGQAAMKGFHSCNRGLPHPGVMARTANGVSDSRRGQR
jgi:hypothetical protein